MKDQIFISYRRNGGEAMAQLLHDKLVARGYAVFYDIESLKSGPFDRKLYEKIEECEDLVLVLPPQALDRCIYDEDWVRCEIRHALRHGKNIIPIIMRGFVFPGDLPADIQAVSKMHGVEFETMEYLDARIEKIVSMLRSEALFTANRKSEDSGAPSLIRNVCSLGSCDFDNAFPKDAYYSEVIDRDKHNVIYFHLSTVRMEKTKISSYFAIYDEKDHKVHEDDTEFDWAPEYDTVARSWVVKGTDGTFVKTGVYRAEFRVEDSVVYEYYFKITSENSDLIEKGREKEMPPNPQNDIPEDLKKGRTRPFGLLVHFMVFVGFCIFATGISADSLIALIAGPMLMVVFCAGLVVYTKRQVWNSWLGAIALSTVLYCYYGIYLLGSLAMYMLKRAKWERRQQR